MNLLGFGKQTLPSVINDPFKKGSIKTVFVHVMEVNGEWRFTGKVEFINGQTEGSQRFTGSSFDDVVLQIKAMIESL